ncbi:carboxypeptidase regulatory-like domain-containing protein [Candidatus Nomurabacteria bacterium]|nr:carboxypeptidase regulatory-like domain-containing protein [Candidatus Nomurabacteria bacterium]
MSIKTIIAILILIGAFLAINYDKKHALAPLPNDNVVCTADAMQCPDGSYVGRTGPNCDFVCPDVKPTPKPTNPPITTGTVKGRVVVSPTCGNIPADGSCPPGPYKTSILFFNEFTKYTAHSDEDGYYSIDIPIGSYKVQAKDGDPFPKCEIVSTTVESAKTNTLNITCDSGVL